MVDTHHLLVNPVDLHMAPEPQHQPRLSPGAAGRASSPKASAEAGGAAAEPEPEILGGGPPISPPDSALPEEREVSPSELSKWTEMIDVGVTQYMRDHPDRFRRRVRRGIPPKFRWHVWKAAMRLRECELPCDYAVLAAAENQWTDLIRVDIGRTFAEVKAFDATQQQRLLRVLNAYAAYNPEVGYCQGMNFVAGLLLLVSACEEESFGILVCLLDNAGLAGFYKQRLPLLRRYLRACDKLVQEKVPELREHFIKEGVQPAVYLHQWFLTLFINCFPLSMVLIIWDVIICEGLPVVLRIAVSILQVLKDSLLSMHFEEIIKFFKMMKTYEDEDGELNAFRIGQLLMKHTELVQIPQHVMEYLNRDPNEEDPNLDSEESWEAEIASSRWLQPLMRMFSFGSTKRRSSYRSPGIESGHGGSESSLAGASGELDNTADTGQPDEGGTGGRAAPQRMTSTVRHSNNLPDETPASSHQTEVEEDCALRGWEFL